MLKLEHPKLKKQQTDFVNANKIIINKVLYEENNISQRSKYQHYLDRAKIEDANKVTETNTKYSPIQTPLIIDSEISQLENQEYKSEDLERYVQELNNLTHLALLKRNRRSESSDEDNQQLEKAQKQLKNAKLFEAIRKKEEKHRRISEDDRIKELQECLKEGADINAQNTKGNTVLHIAAEKNYKDIVEFLLKQQRIDVDITNKYGKTALNLAEDSNNQDIVQILESYSRELPSRVLVSPSDGGSVSKITDNENDNKKIIDSKSTEGDGNCFFHAVFGDNISGKYKAEKAGEMRQEWHNFLNQFASQGLKDSNMPAALKDQLKKIFQFFLNNPDDLTTRSDAIKGLVAETKSAITKAENEIIELKNKIIQKFQGNEEFRNEIHQIILKAREKTGKQAPNIQKLLNDRTSLLSNEISNVLEECALKFNPNLSHEKYNEQYNSQAIADSFLENPEVYKNYLAAIKQNSYYVFFEEIPILSSLANIKIHVYYNNGREQQTFSPKEELRGSYPLKPEIWGSKKAAIIWHSGMHFEHAEDSVPKLLPQYQSSVIDNQDIEDGSNNPIQNKVTTNNKLVNTDAIKQDIEESDINEQREADNNLAEGSNNEEHIQKHSDVSRTNSQQQIQQPINTNGVDRQVMKLVNLLGLQLPLPDGKISLTEDQLKKLEQVDREGNIWLLRVALSDNEEKEAIGFLIRCGVDVNYQNLKTKQSAIDIVWEKGYYNSMLMLLKADSNFPKNFTLDALYQDDEIPKELKIFVTDREKLHEWIKNNKLEEVKNFVLKHKLSKFLNNKNKSALETAAEYANVETLAVLTYIQLPLREITLVEEQLKLLKQVNKEGDTLLSIAAKNGKKDNVDFFVKCGIDINHRNESKKSAIDLAWENKHYDIVLTLLKADSDFPNGFNLDSLNEENAQKELKQFVEERNNLHKLIKEDNLEDIKDFTANSKSKFYLNSQGQSAVFTAIENKKFDIYAFLKSVGVNFRYENEEEGIKNLFDGEKDKLKTAMINYFPSSDKAYISYFIAKSRSKGPIENFQEKMKNFYEKLDLIPEISTILKVIQYTDYLDVIFDFDNENIQDMNPTASEATKGTTDYKEGRLYIAAKMQEAEILGTLAHELAHLAMQIIYENDCNPYSKSDTDKTEAFKQITTAIQNKPAVKQVIEKIKHNPSNVDNSPIVILARAFRYPESEQQSELIVRIPHILAQYSEDKTWLSNYNDLKSYYSNNILPKCDNFIEQSFLIKPRNTIKLLNQVTGEVNSIKELDIQFQSSINLNQFFNKNENDKQILLLSSENTLLSSLSIYQTLQNTPNYADNYLIFKFNSYVKQQDEINKAFYSEVSKLLIIVYPNNSDDTELSNLHVLSTLLSQKLNKKVIFIVDKKKVDAVKKNLDTRPSDKYLEQTYIVKFSDLISDSQKKLLEKNIVIFQGKEISLNKLIDQSDENAKQIIDSETLIKLIKGADEVTIGSKLKDLGKINDYYIPRMFNRQVTFNKAKIKEDIERNSISDFFVISGTDSGLADTNNKIYVFDKDAIESARSKFAELCKQNTGSNIHWLKSDSRKLTWYKSQGSISNLVKYKEIDKVNKNDYKISKEDLIDEEKLINHDNQHKIVIISDTAGMGKTTVLTSLSKGIKNDKPNSWVIRIDLNSHTIVLGEEVKNRKSKQPSFSSNNEAIDFLLDKLLGLSQQSKSEINFERRLLEYNLKHKGSVIVLFDGFDEISPNYKDIVIDLIQALKTQVEKLWVTTRPPMRPELESKLGIFAYTLKPLSQEEQIVFLTKFWQKRNPKFTNKQKIEVYAKTLIELLAQSISDKEKEFTGIPLQIRMVAEVFEKKQEMPELLDEILEDKREKIKPIKEGLEEFYFSSVEKPYFSEKINLLTLYELFIYKKYCDIYEIEKKGSDFSKPTIKESIKELYPQFIQKHQKLALYSLFTREQCKTLLSEQETKGIESLVNDIKGGKERRGIIDQVIESKPHFVHQTFAEYFGADFLVDQLKREQLVDQLKREQQSREIQEFLLTNILIKPEYPVIRAFLNGQLDNENPSDGVLKKYGEQINQLWLDKRLTTNDDRNTVLHIAAEEDNAQIVSFLLNSLKDEKYVDTRNSLVTSINRSGITALHNAAKNGNLDVVELLVKNGADVNARDTCQDTYQDTYGKTALHRAAESNKWDVVEWLVKNGANVNVQDTYGETVLHQAAESNKWDVVEWLVKNGANVNVQDTYGETVLHQAAESNKWDVVEWLVKNGANVNVQDTYDKTVLHQAARSSNLAVVQFLVKPKVEGGGGADVNAKNNDGKTALDIAKERGYQPLVMLLEHAEARLESIAAEEASRQSEYPGTETRGEPEPTLGGAGCSMDASSSSSTHSRKKRAIWNCLEQEEESGKQKVVKSGKWHEVVRWLIEEKGADINAKDEFGRTILHKAAEFGRLDLVKWLLEEQGANINILDKYDTSLLHFAAASGNLALVKWLIEEKHVVIDAQDKFGKSVLHLAALDNYQDITALLVAKNADINLRDRNGETALDLARKEQHQDIVKQLQKASIELENKQYIEISLDNLTELQEEQREIGLEPSGSVSSTFGCNAQYRMKRHIGSCQEGESDDVSYEPLEESVSVEQARASKIYSQISMAVILKHADQFLSSNNNPLDYILTYNKYIGEIISEQKANNSPREQRILADHYQQAQQFLKDYPETKLLKKIARNGGEVVNIDDNQSWLFDNGQQSMLVFKEGKHYGLYSQDFNYRQKFQTREDLTFEQLEGFIKAFFKWHSGSSKYQTFILADTVPQKFIEQLKLAKFWHAEQVAPDNVLLNEQHLGLIESISASVIRKLFLLHGQSPDIAGLHVDFFAHNKNDISLRFEVLHEVFNH